ncbi:MAG: hypothetical protein WBP42_10525 [Candidatus Zixiibacteriota bacterium]
MGSLTVFAVIALLGYGSIFAGDTKTFGGEKVDEDSVAVLKLYAEIGRIDKPSTIFVFATKIDSMRIYDATFSGEDPSGAYLTTHEKFLNDLLTDFVTAQRVNTAKLDCRSHSITVQCVQRYNRKQNGEFGSSGPTQLVFTPEPGRKYEPRATCEGLEWRIWIADQKTKQIVSLTPESK